MNLLPAYGVPTEGECMVTVGLGTACGKEVVVFTDPLYKSHKTMKQYMWTLLQVVEILVIYNDLLSM